MHKCKKHPCPNPATCKCRTIRDAKIPIIWLIGGTGSGKKTHGIEMAKKFHFDFISTGDLLRSKVASGSNKAQEYQRLMSNGILVPDEEVIELLEKTMKQKLKESHGFVLSFTKNVQQADLFEKFIAPVDLIIYLECSDDAMMARTLTRAKAAGSTAATDDTEFLAQVRIEQFRKSFDAIQAKYADKIKTIDCNGAIAEIWELLVPLVEQTIAYKLENTTDPKCD